MKKLLLCIAALLIVASAARAQGKRVPLSQRTSIISADPYPLVSIHDLQYISPDSLRFCDSVLASIGTGTTGGGTPAWAPWTKQTSAYYSIHTGGVRDTVEIVGQIIVPPKYIMFTGYGGYNFTLRDTAANPTGAWSAIFVRTANAADTAELYGAGLLTYGVGDIIRIRGFVDEYPSNNMVSYTEFVPIGSAFVPTATMERCVEYVGTAPVPPPIHMSADQFMNGGYDASGKNILCSTGEQWEDCYVQLTNLTVVGDVKTSDGTVALQDQDGNEISTMDGSKWFSLGSFKDPSSAFSKPKVGQVIDTIRGYIATNSGSDAPRGYRIYPVFQGDMVFGKTMPIISTHRRNPVAVTSTDTAKISVKAYALGGGAALSAVLLHYCINDTLWQVDTMQGPNAADSTWLGEIVPQAENTFIKYYCTAADLNGNTSIVANAAGGSAPVDTTQGYFFYSVLDRQLTIHDVQYTPFKNGTSGLIGAVVTIAGVVTADSSDLNINAPGTSPWYIQTGNAPWNGIWVYDARDILSPVHKGDSVSVTGTVQEYNDGLAGSVGRVTRIYDSLVTVISSGNPVPAPVMRTTAQLSASNGAATTEPYEGMLVRIDSITISNIAPTYSDSTEYAINDGSSGDVIVRSADGRSIYSPLRGDTLYGKTILHQGDKFGFIQGILYFSFNQYKLVPRTSSDYGTYTPAGSVGVLSDNNVLPKKFALAHNYPNPFNPKTVISYQLPVISRVTLKIYDILGREVATLVDGTKGAGAFSATFDGAHLSSGVYIVRLSAAPEAGSRPFVQARKMLLVK
jgi:hypothetical protein